MYLRSQKDRYAYLADLITWALYIRDGEIGDSKGGRDIFLLALESRGHVAGVRMACRSPEWPLVTASEKMGTLILQLQDTEFGE